MRRTILIGALSIMLLLSGCVGAIDGIDGDDLDDDDHVDESTDDADQPTDDADQPTDDADQSTDDVVDDPVDGELAVHHIDVGQADATLLVTPDGETILIDSGDWRQDGSDVIAYLESLGIDRIDHLVATHPHADHIGGHAAVIEHFETNADGIGAAYDSGVIHDTATYERYLDAVEEHDVELFVVEEGDELPLAEQTVSATVLNPPAGDSGSDLHYNSVVIAFEFGEFRYLTTSDAEDDVEQRLVDEWADELDADLYQAGHHGSSTSSTQAFMEHVDADVAVISSSYDSQYGHPHDEVLERFSDIGIETYWTAVHGDVVVRTDGETMTVEPSVAFSTDPQDLLAEKPAEDEEDDDEIEGDESETTITYTVNAYTHTANAYTHTANAYTHTANADTAATVEGVTAPLYG